MACTATLHKTEIQLPPTTTNVVVTKVVSAKQSAKCVQYENRTNAMSSVSGRWGMSQGMRADARAVCIPGGTPVMRGPPQGSHLPTC